MSRSASTAPSPTPLIYPPPAPSWRPPIGEGAARWTSLIGPGHQAGRRGFEAASSAANVIATPPGLTHWLLGAPQQSPMRHNIRPVLQLHCFSSCLSVTGPLTPRWFPPVTAEVPPPRWALRGSGPVRRARYRRGSRT